MNTDPRQLCSVLALRVMRNVKRHKASRRTCAMNPRFNGLIESLHSKLQSLISMVPVTVDTPPKDSPKGGVYLFSQRRRPSLRRANQT